MVLGGDVPVAYHAPVSGKGTGAGQGVEEGSLYFSHPS